MSAWRREPFDAVIADESGGNLKTLQSEFLPTGRYPIVDQGKDLVAGYTDDESRLCRATLPVIVFGDHTRCFKYVDFPFCMGADGIKVLRPKIEADVKYLYHYLRQLRLTEGGYDRHFKYLKRSIVVVPPLPEQRRIAEILDKADALQAKRRAALAQIDTLTQSIFLDMFGHSEGNDYPLGQHAVRVTKGTTPTTVGYSFADSGIPLLRVQNLRGDRIDFAEDVLYVSEKTHQALSRSQIHPGDVLTTIAGTIGRTVVVPANAPAANCNQAIAIITPRGSLNSLYLCHWLRSRSALQQMSQSQVTATISNLSLGQIRSLTIPVPSNADQCRFAGRAEAVQRAKAAHEAALAELDALFASLQHRAFRGEL